MPDHLLSNVRTQWIVVVVALVCCGCSRPDGSAFDGLLTSNRIDGIQIVNTDTDTSKVLTGQEAARLLDRLAESNRLARPIRGRSYASGYIELQSEGRTVGRLSYFPREQVLYYQKYEFTLRDTNDIFR